MHASMAAVSSNTVTPDRSQSRKGKGLNREWYNTRRPSSQYLHSKTASSPRDPLQSLDCRLMTQHAGAQQAASLIYLLIR